MVVSKLTVLGPEHILAAMESLKDTPEREAARIESIRKDAILYERFMSRWTVTYPVVDKRAIGRWKRKHGARFLRFVPGSKRLALLRVVKENDHETQK